MRYIIWGSQNTYSIPLSFMQKLQLTKEFLSWDFVRKEARIQFGVSRKPDSFTESMINTLLENRTFASFKNWQKFATFKICLPDCKKVQSEFTYRY